MRQPCTLLICAFALIAALLPTQALAQDDVRVTASVRKNRIYMGDELLIEVRVEGADSPRQPTTPEVDGAAIRFLGGSNVSRSFTMIVNGKRTNNNTKGYTFQYALTPTRPGQMTLPPIEVEVNGVTFKTDPIRVEAIEPQSDSEFALELAIDEDRVYVGQPVRARVTWFIAAAVNEFSFRSSPLPDGFDVYLPEQPTSRNRAIEFEIFGERITAVQTRSRRGNVDFPVLSFDIVLIPRKTGRQTVGPLSVVFNRRDSSRVLRRQCLSNEVELEVLPLPSAGRPSDFAGLVGVYTIDAQASPTSVAIGDPIELSVTITGPEPLTRLDAPDLARDPGFSESFKPSPDGWRRQPITARGYRRFTTTIRARSDTITEIPPIRVPYFDARTGEYSEALSEPIALEVRAVRQVTAADAITGPRRSAPALTRPLLRAPDGVWALETDPDTLLRTDAFDLIEVAKAPLTITALGAPPVLYAGVVAVGFVRKRRDPVAARRRRALPRARRSLRSGGPPAGVRTLVSDLLDRPTESVTAQDCLELAPESADACLLASVLSGAESGRFGETSSAPELELKAILDAMRRLAAFAQTEATEEGDR